MIPRIQCKLTPVPPPMDDKEFAARLHSFHRAVYASVPSVFDRVMVKFWQPEPGCVAHDHCLLHDGRQWHLFVLSNPLALHHRLVEAVRGGNVEAARNFPYTVGDLHLAGPSLSSLRTVGRVLTESVGEWGTLAQTNSFVHRVNNRWVNLYCAMGPRGQRLCLDWSDDLVHWERDPANPVWAPPAWAGGTDVCKGPCIVQHGERYLIYYNLNLVEGTSTVSLISTLNFRTFDDHGPVLKFPCQYRGTQGCESPSVFIRNGLWHLMVGSGDSWWHAVSNRPDRFMSTQRTTSATVQGVYDLGPFHAGKVVCHEGRWFMTSSFKAEHRRRSRQQGIPIFRGEESDERGLLEGLFISEIEWDGDRPLLTKPNLETDRQTRRSVRSTVSAHSLDRDGGKEKEFARLGSRGLPVVGELGRMQKRVVNAQKGVTS